MSTAQTCPANSNCPIVDGHCNLTSLEQLNEPGRNACPNFTFCETRLREQLAATEPK